MINFLKCEGQAVLKLVLRTTFQKDGDGIVGCIVDEINTDSIYDITVADNEYGLKHLNGRIIAFTLCAEKEVLSFVNEKTKPFTVDTITVDCSGDGVSDIKRINVCDIRNISELKDFGFEEIERDKKDIDTFK